MVLKKISEDIPYTRYIPYIFGKNHVYELDGLQEVKGTAINKFIAEVFSGSVLINQDNTIDFRPTNDSGATRTMALNNDEIRLPGTILKGDYSLETIRGVTIPLMRPGFDIYGHWLLDLLPKLAVFEKLNPNIRYSILVDSRCPEWAINLIGEFYSNFITIKKIDAGTPIMGNFFLMSPIRYHDFISRMCKIDVNTFADASARDLKLYISRKHLNLNHRQLENSTRIEKLFSRKGFSIVYPEELTLKEQRQLFSRASVLAGEAGSGLHNSIFCPKETIVINIQSGRQNHFIQASLCNLYNQDVIYVSGRSKTSDWGSSFKVTKRDCKMAIKRAMTLK